MQQQSKLGMPPRAAMARSHIGYIPALFRFFTDSRGSLATKLMVLVAAFYVVMPLDLIPDLIPIIGWMDDIGVATFALAFLAKKVADYRRDYGVVPDAIDTTGHTVKP